MKNSKTIKQQKAFDKLSRLKVGALFMEMGTGKTRVALDLINSKATKVDYALWICPCSIKEEIRQECEKWYPKMKLDIVGCESIGMSDRIFLEVLSRVRQSKSFVVVDESLKIKNREAKRTKRILTIGESAEYKLILNGTPLSKNVLDLWAQMQFLSPKILNMSYDEFKNTYCEYYLHGELKGVVKKQYNVEHLTNKIRPYIFDAELEVEANKKYISISYEMDEQERAYYEAVKKTYLASCMFNSDFDFLQLANLLQRAYCRAEQKKNQLDRAIREIDDKVIIFVKYLESIPQGELCITGATDETQRKAIIEKFKTSSDRVLYITYGCGAFGLNLQFCKNIIFADHTFDYAQRIQAEARIYRMGQSEDCTYYNLWCQIGLENLIKASLTKKSNLLDEVKTEIEKAGVEEWLKSI